MSEYCRDCERLSQDCDALSADNNKLTARVEELEVNLDDSVPIEAFAALEARCGDQSNVICNQDLRIAELEAENAALRHDLSKSMANHVADINGSQMETACEHRYVDVSNAIVESGEVCLQCGAIRPSEPNRTVKP